MTEKLIDCPRCESNACSEMSDGKVTIWVCMGCGFTSNTTITDINVEQMESTLPELYKTLKYKDESGKSSNPMLFNRLIVLEEEINKQIKRIENDENKDLLEVIELYYDKK